MTEAEWLAATDPTPMLEILKGKASDRKLRLFAVAACRRTSLWRLFSEACKEAINLAEQFADGAVGWKQLWDAREEISDTKASFRNKPFDGHSWRDRDAWAKAATEAATIPVIVPQWSGTCGFLRDIFGNPFRPVAVEPSWLTPTVVQLAKHIYQERAFDQMPILADALQDAGCDNPDILNHCREPREHVRGCWVVDLLTGRK